LTILQQLNNVT